MANQHTTAALGFESRRDWTSAKDQYQAIITEITSELTQSQQNQTLYYFLGLANTDYARMLLNMGNGNLNDYLQHLNAAEQALQRALALAQGGPIPAAQVYTSMAVVKTFQGNYAGAQTDVANVQQLKPNDSAAASVQQTLTSLPTANRDISQELRMYRMSSMPIQIGSAKPVTAPSSKPAPTLTDNQSAALLHLAEAVARLFYPKTVSVVAAGIEVVRAFQAPAQ